LILWDIGYCESIVRISPDISPKSKKNRKTSAELDRSCQRFISLQAGHNKHVELKKTWIRQGQRVLLFIDWIDTIEPILAVRDVIRHIGGEVIGVAFVICTNPTLLKELKAYEIPFSFSWVPSSGGELTMDNSHTGVTCKSSGTSTSKSLSHKRKREQTGTSRQVFHVTTHYEANAPGEDRSVNITKPNDEDVKIFGVFDGHGGNIAVK
jgi:hypothetical protein